MSRTETLRRQHQENLGLVTDLTKYLMVNNLKENPREASKALSTLVGKLKIHFSMEDQVLYPVFENHADPKIKEKCKKYADEMKVITPVVLEWANKWKPVLIQENPQVFIEETKGIFKALGDRVNREESDLYPIADQI